MAEEWILDLTKELQLPHTPADQELYTKSIYGVPKILTDVNSQAYEPKFVSFGPYHHDRRHLRPMEQHKHRALVQFLRRIAKASKTIQDVLNAMRNVEPQLLVSYDSLQVDEDDEEGYERGRFCRRHWLKEKDEFIKLMIVDGCFALEVMLADKRSAAGEPSEYDSHDPIFGVERMYYVLPDLKRDMLLLENQIPLLALTTLAAIDGSGIGDVSALIKGFYYLSSVSPDDEMIDEGLHVLDLYRKVLTAEGEYFPSYEENVQSATELRNAGVSFCKSNTITLRDISFNNGVLSLPPLEIDDTTEPLLLNLMAFERLHGTAGNGVTAYVFFMGNLISSGDDIALLRTEEIIMGWVGCDRDIAIMFQNITKEATLVVFKDDIQVDVNSKLNRYYQKRKHQWWRVSFVSLSTILLALTIVQTMFTILQYYYRK